MDAFAEAGVDSMSYSMNYLQEIVIAAAREELLPRFARVARQHKIDGSVLTEADLAMQQRLAGLLQQQFPDTVFLGEEMDALEQKRLLQTDKPVWCLDPLDGTSNFAAGIPYFCVSLALLQQGKVVLGLVYDPLRDECFATDPAQRATLNGESLATVESGLSLDQATALVDFKRLQPALATQLVAATPYASQRSFGSVALDWCWLAAGRSHVYLHGCSNIWDYAAGNYIFLCAGGFASTLDGDAVFTHELKPRSAVAAVDQSLFAEWCACLGVRLQG
jgi:myo-inositol-1(or 4)-monophosphatase